MLPSFTKGCSMTLSFTRVFLGPLKLAVLDLAGTVVDFGSRAPAGAFVELFAREGIRISETDARGPMGMHKRDHIAAICALPQVVGQWQSKHDRPVSENDVQALYDRFIPMQIEVLPDYTDPVPGAAEAIGALRARGLRIGFTTGYSRDMMDIVLSAAARYGIIADTAVCGSDVPTGRPAPWMALECARRTGIYPPAACIKFGDTIVDVEAGRNAGMWSIGAAISGNMTGLSLADWEALPKNERQGFRAKAKRAMHAVGAHAVIDSVRDLPSIVDRINAIMKEGGGPESKPYS
jgi:phosphonoacetaldehyde hydrolase